MESQVERTPAPCIRHGAPDAVSSIELQTDGLAKQVFHALSASCTHDQQCSLSRARGDAGHEHETMPTTVHSMNEERR